MASSDEFRASLKSRYGFADWAKTIPPRSLAPKRKFVPQAERLDAFAHERRRALPDHQNAYIDFYRDKSDPQVLFSVIVIEHPTPEEAHEGLIDFLMTVMAPTLPTASEKEIGVGDIGFAGLGEVQTDVSFVRGNTFVRVQSIGERSASVKELAHLLDRQIQQYLSDEDALPA